MLIKIPLKRAQRVLERDLAYTLHKPRRRRFPTLPVVVGGLDDQWVADLVEVQPLAKYNQGIRYLLMVLDVLSKYAWVQPFKAKTGVALAKPLARFLNKVVNPTVCKRIEAQNFTIARFNAGSRRTRTSYPNWRKVTMPRAIAVLALRPRT